VAGGGPLPVHVVDFLLGYDRTPAEIDALHAAGTAYDPFAQFTLDTMPREELLGLWREHGAYLRAEARRSGIDVPDPETYQPYPLGCWVRSRE